MTSPAFVTDFSDSDVAARITEGPGYTEISHRHFENPGKGAIAGIWQSDAYSADEAPDFDELCHILDGQVRLTDAAGVAKVFGPGDSFVIRAGFRGRWENLGPVRKVFFILR